MGSPSSLSGCARREPCQHRGEVRVAALLAAAIAEFSATGYESATMSAIARRAKAPIGSLYQFFPNKQAVARALRTRHIQDVETLWEALLPSGGAIAVPTFADRLVAVMVHFVEGHPAFLALMDAPSSTQPIGPRHRLRKRLEGMFLILHPGASDESVARLAETTMNINKTFLTMYARAERPERDWIVEEYQGVVRALLARHLMPRQPAPRATVSARRTRKRSGIAPPSR
jgi:AcrR family transcriptional regulator